MTLQDFQSGKDPLNINKVQRSSMEVFERPVHKAELKQSSIKFSYEKNLRKGTQEGG